MLQPHCSRCIKNSRQDQCVYPKPRTFGRPPKKAILHKNIVSTSCREFIFEGEAQQKRRELTRKDPKVVDIERIFKLYMERGKSLSSKLYRKGGDGEDSRKAKKILQNMEVFSAMTSNVVHLTLKRSCQLLDLKSYFDPELTILAFVKTEQIDKFFFNRCTATPLNSVPTEEATRLFHCFFQFNPHCILLNKTRLLESYWNDSIEPLLLSVVYGIAVSLDQQDVADEKLYAFSLRKNKRNPFLDYAYTLLEYICSNQVVSLGNYQAIVLLSIYEIKFGLAKHGMTMLSLSYMMAAELGIFDNNDRFCSMDLIDSEQLVSCYWAAFRFTSHGCLELGIPVRESLLFHRHPFPPANAHTSASYQYDILHNNQAPNTRVHLIECFHSEMVVNYFSSKLFVCFPMAQNNMLDLPARRTDMNLALLLFQGDNEDSIRHRIQLALEDFSTFIVQEKHQWTPEQLFTIETTYRLYCVHFSFMKSGNSGSPIRYETTAELDLNDPTIASKFQQLLPVSYTLIDDLKQFTEQRLDREKILGLMAMTLETAVQLLIQNCLLFNERGKTMEYLDLAYSLSKQKMWINWVPIKSVQKMTRNFLRHQRSVNLEPMEELLNQTAFPEIDMSFLAEVDCLFQNTLFQL